MEIAIIARWPLGEYSSRVVKTVQKLRKAGQKSENSGKNFVRKLEEVGSKLKSDANS